MQIRNLEVLCTELGFLTMYEDNRFFLSVRTHEA